jgi:hypothetical protein
MSITLDKLETNEPKSVIPKLVAKVIFLSPEKQSKYSPFRTATIKDIKNQKTFWWISQACGRGESLPV